MTPDVVETSGQENAIRALDRIKDYTVVDADVHEISIDLTPVLEYLEEPYRSMLEQSITTDEPLAQGLGASFNFDLDPTPHGLGQDVKTTTPEGLAAFMDRFNTDYLLLHGHQLGSAASQPDEDYSAALCSATNDYILDHFLDKNEGFKSGIRIPSRNVDAAVEEIHRLADEEDMVSIHLSPPKLEHLGNDTYEPIWEAASEVGMPVDYHIGYVECPWTGAFGGQSLHSAVEHMSAISQQMIGLVPEMIFNGVVERYPDVNHIFLEQGITWIPWMMGRLDKNYERRKHMLPELSKKPSEQLHDNFWFGTQPIEDMTVTQASLYRILEMIDAENLLMYSSDFPHFDFDYPTALTIPELSEEAERKIFGGNAMKVYDF